MDQPRFGGGSPAFSCAGSVRHRPLVQCSSIKRVFSSGLSCSSSFIAPPHCNFPIPHTHKTRGMQPVIALSKSLCRENHGLHPSAPPTRHQGEGSWMSGYIGSLDPLPLLSPAPQLPSTVSPTSSITGSVISLSSMSHTNDVVVCPRFRYQCHAFA